MASQSCDMLPWRFNTFVSASGRHDVQADIDRLDETGLAYLQAQVKRLSGAASMKDWSEPQAKKLKGYEDLYEVRFKAHRTAMRAVGFFGPSDGEFTILILCNHKDNVYKPANALDTAAARRKLFAQQAGRCAPLQIDGEEFPPPDEA